MDTTFNCNKLFKLTSFQKIFYYEWILNPLRTDYNLVADWTLEGYLDIKRLNQSLIRFVNEHLLMHCNVLSKDNELFWTERELLSQAHDILEVYSGNITEYDLLSIISKPFNIENDQLIRFVLVNYENGKYRFITIIQHIIIDGLSANSLFDNFAKYYNNPSYKNALTIDEQRCSHERLCLYFENIINQKHREMIHFWTSQLNETIDTDLSFLKYVTPNIRKEEKKISEISFQFESIYFNSVKHTSRKLGITPYLLSQVIFASLLYRVSGDQNIGLSFPVAISEGKDLIYGAHINTIPIKFSFSEDTSIYDLVNQVISFHKQLKLSKGKYLPINEISKYLKNKSILDISFVQTNLRNTDVYFNGICKQHPNKDLYIDLNSTLQIEQEESSDCLKFRVKYNNEIINQEILFHFIESYKYLFSKIVKDVLDDKFTELISSYPLLSNKNASFLVYDWNLTRKAYPCDRTVHALFEEQAERTPDNLAVVYEDVRLTYAELNERSNRLARHLLSAYALRPDDLVVLCLDRSERMIVSILAVLKCGAAYVPVSPGYPSERISYVLSDTGARVVLCDSDYVRLFECLCDSSTGIVPVGDPVFEADLLSGYPSTNPVTEVGSGNLAYVIYTSGTTGKPKGVMVEHRSVVNRIKWMNTQYPLVENDKILQKTPYTFDVSVWELFWANWYGACIVFAHSEDHKDSMYIAQLIQDEKITVIHFVPSMFDAFIDSIQSNGMAFTCNTLRHIFCSGETLNIHTVKKGRLLFNSEIHNLYGPTETTVDVLYYDCNSKNIDSIFIGRPIANTTAYVLDSCLRPLPVGAIGELYIGGDGVARGYLNNAALTAERFLANPFQSEADKQAGFNDRIYKTGDLVRYLPDGNIEYIGRNDFQVKIRGFRIELGEIESRISSYPGIRQSVVAALEHGSGTKYLVGYYVSDSELPSSDLEAFLSQVLPDYMLPSAYVRLDSLPLTPNGKLDRKALPVPSFTDTRTYSAPENELQVRMCGIYADVLGLNAAEIGIDDDFFRLGGNSILAIKLVNRLSLMLEIEVRVSDLFGCKTIRKLCNNLHGKDSSLHILAQPVSCPEEQRLSFAQERLWFIDSYEGGSHAYNIPMVLCLQAGTDGNLLLDALKMVIERHEILRTLIRVSDSGAGYQSVLSESDKAFDVSEVLYHTPEELQDLCRTESHHVFSLGEDYPIRARLFHTPDGIDRHLMIVVHHIAFDGWSMEILLKDLVGFYMYLSTGDVSCRPVPLPVQYKDFALWQRGYLQGSVLEKELAFWKSHLSGFETLNLPADYARPAEFDYKGADILFTLDADISDQLRQLAREEGVSLYSVLLSGFYLMLSCYSGQDDIVVGTPVANRHYREIEDLVGFFVNSMALRMEMDPQETLQGFIHRVAHLVEEAQMHQDIPFERLVESLGVPQDNSRNPVFQVMFSLQEFTAGEDLSFGINSLFRASDFSSSSIYNPAKFDLSTILEDNGSIISGIFNYATSIFRESSICTFIATYKNILSRLVSVYKEVTVGKLQYLNSEELDTIVYDWNLTRKAYPCDRTVHALFEEQAERTPDNLAVVYEDVRLTYAELNERSNRLARHLLSAYALRPDDLVVLWAHPINLGD